MPPPRGSVDLTCFGSTISGHLQEFRPKGAPSNESSGVHTGSETARGGNRSASTRGLKRGNIKIARVVLNSIGGRLRFSGECSVYDVQVAPLHPFKLKRRADPQIPQDASVCSTQDNEDRNRACFSLCNVEIRIRLQQR
jgi:hypothetical protein